MVVGAGIVDGFGFVIINEVRAVQHGSGVMILLFPSDKIYTLFQKIRKFRHHQNLCFRTVEIESLLSDYGRIHIGGCPPVCDGQLFSGEGDESVCRDALHIGRELLYPAEEIFPPLVPEELPFDGITLAGQLMDGLRMQPEVVPVVADDVPALCAPYNAVAVQRAFRQHEPQMGRFSAHVQTHDPAANAAAPDVGMAAAGQTGLRLMMAVVERRVDRDGARMGEHIVVGRVGEGTAFQDRLALKAAIHAAVYAVRQLNGAPSDQFMA